MSCGSPRLPALFAAALVAAIALPTALQAAPAVRAPVVTGNAQVGGTLTAKVATPATVMALTGPSKTCALLAAATA